jgi:ribokinase
VDSPEVVVAGQVARDLVLVVPEVPDAGDTAAVSARREMLGGKGANIAVALAQLGMPVTLLGVVGDDEVGDRLLTQAEHDHVDTSAVVRRAATSTALIVDLVTEDAQWRYLEDIPDEVLLTEADVRSAAAVLTKASSVVVQLQQPSAAALAAAGIAQRAGRRLVLDGAPADDPRRDALLAAAEVLRVDQHEGELLTGVTLGSAQAALRAGRDLLDRGPSLVALATDEANVFVWHGDQVVIPLVDTEVRDTTGGGDAFTAALTAALTRGQSPHRAARLAVAASAATVGHPGGRPELTQAALDEFSAQLGGQGAISEARA